MITMLWILTRLQELHNILSLKLINHHEYLERIFFSFRTSQQKLNFSYPKIAFGQNAEFPESQSIITA